MVVAVDQLGYNDCWRLCSIVITAGRRFEFTKKIGWVFLPAVQLSAPWEFSDRAHHLVGLVLSSNDASFCAPGKYLKTSFLLPCSSDNCV